MIENPFRPQPVRHPTLLIMGDDHRPPGGQARPHAQARQHFIAGDASIARDVRGQIIGKS